MVGGDFLYTLSDHTEAHVFQINNTSLARTVLSISNATASTAVDFDTIPTVGGIPIIDVYTTSSNIPTDPHDLVYTSMIGIPPTVGIVSKSTAVEAVALLMLKIVRARLVLLIWNTFASVCSDNV